MQILFPEPQLGKLRIIAKEQDRPVSELIRNAVDFWLSRHALEELSSVAEHPPVYSCGDISVSSKNFRNIAHSDREEL